ncbi:MAG: hypothetical protein RIA65_02910 [Woeseia sp.]
MTDGENEDDIPVLTDAIERMPTKPAAMSGVDLDALQADICGSSLRIAEAMLLDACREAEHVLMERTMSTLRAELPAIVRGALKEHLDK